jgi:lysozyme
MDPIVITQLEADEGFRAGVYVDTTGNQTVGFGRNLNAHPFTRAEAESWLIQQVAVLDVKFNITFPWYPLLSDVRRRVLVNMAYNLGFGGVLEFRDMLRAIEAKDFAGAAAAMLSSVWAIQVGARADRLSQRMATDRE